VTVTLAQPAISDVTIPAGTALSTAGGEANFETDEDLVIPTGETAGKVLARCTATGAVGNVPANTVTLMPGATVAIASVTNQFPFVSGADDESDQQMKARFVAYIGSIARGIPVSIEYAARSQVLYHDDGTIRESIERVAIHEFAGYVRVFVYSGPGGTSVELIDQIQKVIDGYYDTTNEVLVSGYRAAGIFVYVASMTERAVDLSLEVDLLPGYAATTDMQANIVTAVSYAIRTHQSGKPLTVGKILNAALAVPGVKDATVTPAASVSCAPNEALQPGSINITWT
jgi:uncharacterized phage protein gp47/JayE